MQQQIGAFEAKTHFSQIIENVESGADYIITKRGKPVAQIVPLKKEPEITRKDAIAQIIEMRNRLYRGKPGDFNIREAIEEGRR